MTKYLEDKRDSLILAIVCFMTYTIISFTRNAYSAAIVGIISEGYFTKADAGIIATSFYITYCISQIIGSYYVDKFSPFKIILFGSVVTIFANVVMSLNPTYWVMFIFRAICGASQFGIWPALLRILSEYINKDHRRMWSYILPLGMSFSHVLSYLAAAVVPKWRGLFTLSYMAMAGATIVFMITARYAQNKAINASWADFSGNNEKIESTENTNSIGVFELVLRSGALFLVIPVFSRSLINGGITNWMPTMIMESYNVSPAISSIVATISTCANFVAVFCVMFFYPRIFKLQTTATGMLFLFMLPFLAVSIFIGNIPMILVVIFIAIINIFSGAIHQFNTVEIPKAYTKFNKVGMMAGLINAVATFAVVISGWLWGWLAEKYSWDVIIAVWTIMAFVSAICCFVATPLWKKFMKNK